MEKLLYPEIPIRCIISGKSNSEKSTFDQVFRSNNIIFWVGI